MASEQVFLYALQFLTAIIILQLFQVSSIIRTSLLVVKVVSVLLYANFCIPFYNIFLKSGTVDKRIKYQIILLLTGTASSASVYQLEFDPSMSVIYVIQGMLPL